MIYHSLKDANDYDEGTSNTLPYQWCALRNAHTKYSQLKFSIIYGLKIDFDDHFSGRSLAVLVLSFAHVHKKRCSSKCNKVSTERDFFPNNTNRIVTTSLEKQNNFPFHVLLWIYFEREHLRRPFNKLATRH